MRLSKKGEYAIRALIELGMEARRSRTNGGWLQISTIAQRTQISEKFLEQILLTIRNAGLLKSKRGADGGYGLNVSPAEIMLGDIVRLMDGPLAPIPCVGSPPLFDCNCPDPETCGLRIAMRQVRDAICAILDQCSLEHIVQEVMAKQHNRSGNLEFQI
jgi:Rrf2 family protein